MTESIPRSVETIQTEYEAVAKQSGQLGYELELTKGRIEAMHRKMYELNQEAHQADQALKTSSTAQEPQSGAV